MFGRNRPTCIHFVLDGMMMPFFDLADNLSALVRCSTTEPTVQEAMGARTLNTNPLVGGARYTHFAKGLRLTDHVCVSTCRKYRKSDKQRDTIDKQLRHNGPCDCHARRDCTPPKVTYQSPTHQRTARTIAKPAE